MFRSLLSTSALASAVLLACEPPPCPEGSAPTAGGRCVEGSDGAIDGSNADAHLDARVLIDEPDGCEPRAEICDAMDQDCDGRADEGLPAVTHYADADRDGFGDPASAADACGVPTGRVMEGGDCDDSCPSCRPSGSEMCDGDDQDCDGTIDEGATITYYADGDRDGHGRSAATIEACELPPGYAAIGDDCNDDVSGFFPGALEVCNALDDDCDGSLDETFPCVQSALSSCITTCGSTGQGTCTASCALPTGAACAPPIESCNRGDDDCDAHVDEGMLRARPRIDLGAAPTRIVALATSRGFVVVFQRSTGIYARRIDETGALVGTSDTLITTFATDTFDATVAGSRILIAWLGSGTIDAIVLNDDLTLATAARALDPVSDLTSRVAVAAAGGNALFFYHNGSSIIHLSRTFPSLSGTAADVTVSGARADFDVTVDPSGPRAFLAYVASDDDVEVRGYSLTGTLQRTVMVTNDTTIQRSPRSQFGTDAAGARRLGVVFQDDPSGTSSDRQRLAMLEVALDGSLTALEIVDLQTVAAPDAMLEPLEVAYTGGAFWVSRLRASSPSSFSSWAYSEVRRRTPAATTVVSTTIEAGADNESTSVAALASGAVLIATSRASGGNGRAYLLTCP